MHRIARFIVEKRIFIFIVFAAFAAYCFFGMSKVNVEYSITAYLPADTDTSIALDIMEDEFTTFGSASMIVRNISFNAAKSLSEEIVELEGVKDLPFENTQEYYSQSTALFNITFEGDDEDVVSVEAYNKIVEMLSPYDLLIADELVNTYADRLQSEINRILLLAVAVIVAVLCFTSESFAEVPVFLVIFGVSALFNMGTNFWLGTISFISNSVCVILQLALAIDYSIILSHRFTESKGFCATPKDAMIDALSKAIPEIAGSSLTTIAGLMALTTMTLRLGADLGVVLTKSICWSIVTVFLLMPGLMLLFSKGIDKTRHKSFIPKISFLGKFDYKLRYVLAPLFLAGAVGLGALSFQTEYVYSQGSIDTSRPSESQTAQEEINRIFGYTNTFVILMPSGDYERQLAVLNMMEEEEMVTSALGVANVQVTMNNQTYYLTQSINYKDFALFFGLDETTASEIFSAYAFFSQESASDGLGEIAVYLANRDIYKTTLLDLFDCAFDHDDFICAYLYDNADLLDSYSDIRRTIQDAEAQLIGENYVRMVFNIDGEVESEETFAFIERIGEKIKSYCPEAVFAGDSMSSYDLNASFGTDNIKISLLTILFVYVILMFTFRSWGIPLPLVLAIQGAIFINFSWYVLSGTNLFFFVYLIVSSIQMGATIDYAIVFTNRYRDLRRTAEKREAVIEALNQSFPTIVTSGTIMAVAGFLIGYLVTDPLIASLGMCLGRGVVVSILSVMLVLPALLTIFDKPLAKTYFRKRDKKIAEGSVKKAIDKKKKKIIKDISDFYEEVKNEDNEGDR